MVFRCEWQFWRGLWAKRDKGTSFVRIMRMDAEYTSMLRSFEMKYA